jgi:hypothetical protein
MFYILPIITLGFFMLPHYATGAEGKITMTTTNISLSQPTEEQRKQWEKNAEEYERLVTSLGGKSIEFKNKAIVTDKQLTKTDIRARL